MTTRREMLCGMMGAAAGSVLAVQKKDTTVELPPANGGRPEEAAKKLVLGVPFLQAPSECSVGVSWTVNCLSFGWVDVSMSPDMSNPRRVFGADGGLVCYDGRIMHVRLEGLSPATRYWYRIGSRHVDYVQNYQRYALDEARGEVLSFVTPGPSAASHFCVMNDTHDAWSSLAPVTEKIVSLAPAVTVWNGDATNETYGREFGVRTFLCPQIPHQDFASRIPLLWVNGNHDFRGFASRNLDDFMMPRPASERSARDSALKWNWAVRQGDVAMIGLDTGEDKPDRHPAFAGLAGFEPYRTAQTAWLKDQFERPEIASAPFVVVFCHIPLFDPRPDANGGDILEGYADWQKQCADEWGPVLNRHSVQLVVAAHMHRFRFDPAGGGRGWDQMVGGGPEWADADNASLAADRFPTVIEGKVADGRLSVVVHNIRTGKVVMERSYGPRQ